MAIREEDILEEVVNGLIEVPGPEGTRLRGQGSTTRGEIESGRSKLIKEKKYPEAKGENKLAQALGSGLVNFLQSTGRGITGMPIDVAAPQAGWQTYMGGKLGAALQDAILWGEDRKTQPNLVEQPASKLRKAAANVPAIGGLSEKLSAAGLTGTVQPTEGVSIKVGKPALPAATEMHLNTEKELALYMIRNKMAVDPTYLQPTEKLETEDAMRQALSTLAFKYKGVNPNDPEIDAAIRETYRGGKGTIAERRAAKTVTPRQAIYFQKALNSPEFASGQITEEDILDFLDTMGE